MAVPAPVLTPGQTAIDLVNRGNALYNKGEFAKALILYRKAEARGAELGTISFNIGNCLYRMDKLPEAAAAFRKTERLTDGQYLPALFNLAAVLFRLEQYGESIAAYRRALKQDPDNASAWLYLADAYTRTRDYVGALQALEKARALDPDDLSIVYQLAETHAAMREFPAAVGLIREAYARKPSEIDFLFYIGDLYRAEGDLESAAGAYREGLALREKDPDNLYKLADVLAQDKKPFLAIIPMPRSSWGTWPRMPNGGTAPKRLISGPSGPATRKGWKACAIWPMNTIAKAVTIAPPRYWIAPLPTAPRTPPCRPRSASTAISPKKPRRHPPDRNGSTPAPSRLIFPISHQ
jgi:tetratricopeptide (TPR) repeat protein